MANELEQLRLEAEQLKNQIRVSNGKCTIIPESNLRRARRKGPLVTMGWDAPNSPQNYPFPFDDHHPI